MSWCRPCSNPPAKPARILALVRSGRITPQFDERILAEYGEVLARPRFGFNPVDVALLLADLNALGEHVAAQASGLSVPDPDDLPFIEVALAGRAEALVTGNVRHFPKESG